MEKQMEVDIQPSSAPLHTHPRVRRAQNLLELLPVLLLKAVYHRAFKILNPAFDTTFQREDFERALTTKL